MEDTMAGSVITLNPEDIRRIGKRTVKVIRLGDGFVAFIMDTVEDGEVEINSAHFQATISEVYGFLHDHDFKTVPLESMELIAEKLTVHKVKRVDMVIPFRKPPSRGCYLKYNPNNKGYDKKPLVIKTLQVEGEKFIVVAMHPLWESCD
jgi:hypothetical protein